MAARVLSSALPNVDYPILDYLTSLFNDEFPDADDSPIESFVRPLLESESIDDDTIATLCDTLQQLWDAQTGNRQSRAPAKLERVVDMRRQEAIFKQSASSSIVPTHFHSLST